MYIFKHHLIAEEELRQKSNARFGMEERLRDKDMNICILGSFHDDDGDRGWLCTSEVPTVKRGAKKKEKVCARREKEVKSPIEG